MLQKAQGVAGKQQARPGLQQQQRQQGVIELVDSD
jgi:hypothetical protein